jgi:hypothetical protein
MPVNEGGKTAANEVGAGARRALLISSVATLALYHVPYGRTLGRPLMWLSTWAHELGHGVAAMLVGARVLALNLYFDGSGTAPWMGDVGRIGRGFISAGGLCGPAVAAAVLFLCARRPRSARLGLFAFAGALLIGDVLLVRTLFGVIFCAAFGLALLAVALRASPALIQTVVAFLGVQLSLSVFSRADYLFTDTAQTGAGSFPSDVAQMSQSLFLPYWFWGATCGAFSILMLLCGLWLFLRKHSP